MKNITAILPFRGRTDGLLTMLDSLVKETAWPEAIEVLIAVDDDDQNTLGIYKKIEQDYSKINVKFFIRPQSEYMTRDYWNWLAKKAEGRWIIILGSDVVVHTPHWDKIIMKRMDAKSKIFGDDILHGLVRDNIRRTGEDPSYPNFSCMPVLSKEHVNVLGYFFDERYWAWGSDQAVTILYKKYLFPLLNEWRLVSLVDVKIFTYNSLHVVDPSVPEEVINEMKAKDKSFQRNIRICQEHPCDLDDPNKADVLYLREAEKLKDYIVDKRKERTTK